MTWQAGGASAHAGGGYRARIWRRVDGKPEQEFCPHRHRTQAAAKTCAQRAVPRWNRHQQDTEQGSNAGIAGVTVQRSP